MEKAKRPATAAPKTRENPEIEMLTENLTKIREEAKAKDKTYKWQISNLK
jgi:hypothetical protein